VTTQKPKHGNPATRQAILDALDRILERHPLDAVGVAEILAEAGLSSRTTYYQHFGSRDEAFAALVENALTEIEREVKAAVDDPDVRRSPALRDAVELWIERGSRHRGLARSMIAEWPRIPDVRQLYLAFMSRLSKRLGKAIDNDRDDGLVATTMPSDRLATMVLWSAERALYAATEGARGFEDPRAVADALVAAHLAVTYGAQLPESARRAPISD
jgi:AcrR family transcriptional regulator